MFTWSVWKITRVRTCDPDAWLTDRLTPLVSSVSSLTTQEQEKKIQTSQSLPLPSIMKTFWAKAIPVVAIFHAT